MNTILTRAYEEGIIRFDENGKVVRVIDGKVFDILGRIELELKEIYGFKRLPLCMNEGGEVTLGIKESR